MAPQYLQELPNATSGEQCKYDVAFSFLAADEPLAIHLNDLLQESVRTFLYLEKQEEVAGKDGEEVFSEVFGKQARVVVVLYRKEWGSTPWTRIEETAIRNRAHDHGYDFAIFIPLDDPPVVPEWLPKTRLYVGLKRWGVNGAVSVIEARVQELGGSPHEETIQARAERLQRKLADAESRKRLLTSEEGVQAADREAAELLGQIEQMIVEINRSCNLSFHVIKTERSIYGLYNLVVVGTASSLSIGWLGKYGNTLKGSELDLAIWDGDPRFPAIITLHEAKKLHHLKFNFDTGPNREPVWHEPGPEPRLYATKDLATFALKLFMDAEEKGRINRPA